LRSLLGIIRSCRRLSRGELMQAARAWTWLIAARAALVMLPYRAVARISSAVPARRGSGLRLTIDQCRVAIRRAGVLASGSCLTRAVAAECLFRREGHTAALALGVRFDQRRLTAHAWVENNGVAVIGHEEAAEYLALGPPRTS
jgi:hypothetical protein